MKTQVFIRFGLSAILLSGCTKNSHDRSRAEFSPDDTRIVTTSSNRNVQIWDVATGKPIAVASDSVIDFSGQASTPALDLFGDLAAAYRDGKVEAQKDIQSGKLVLETSGLPEEWSGMYRSNLWSSHRIELRWVAGCLLTGVIIEGIKGYNEISSAEIERRYGVGIWEQVAKDSEQQWWRSLTNR